MYKQMFNLRYLQFKILEHERLNSAAAVGYRYIINSEINKETKIALTLRLVQRLEMKNKDSNISFVKNSFLGFQFFLTPTQKYRVTFSTLFIFIYGKISPVGSYKHLLLFNCDPRFRSC